MPYIVKGLFGKYTLLDDNEDDSEETEKSDDTDASEQEVENEKEQEEKAPKIDLSEAESESEEKEEPNEEENEDYSDVAYWWKSSHDNRVRPTHRWMNNCIVIARHVVEERPKLSNLYGDPGEIPNCRCRRMPLKSEMLVDDKWYRVYNYKSNSSDKPSGQQFKIKGKELKSYLHRVKHNTD